MIGVRETLCTHCAHREICSNKERFLRAMEAINEVLVECSSKDSSTERIIKLRDITWIKPVELDCIHYVQHVSTPRGFVNDSK